ncbi:hypothetical protein CTAYLR_001889 [Chrysophaeum taylorii]|uniref:Fungal lipase-type domain-containing protein n=1 Tax=Chrysophaeum taylorii TaxID=2483200 RepID=A0AAD7XL37_9STRA|nr:hypothetical protein CTAYLR_001889 [Chrysophaeum taylorii]
MLLLLIVGSSGLMMAPRAFVRGTPRFGEERSGREMSWDEAMDLMSWAQISYSASFVREAFYEKITLIEAIGGRIDPSQTGEEDRVWKKIEELEKRWKSESKYDVDRDPLPFWRFFLKKLRTEASPKEEKKKVPDAATRRAVFDALAHLTSRYPDVRIAHRFRKPFAFVCVSEAAKLVTVVFRGTVRTVDWIYDSQFKLVKLKDVCNLAVPEDTYVHDGFADELLERENRQIWDEELEDEEKITLYEAIVAALADFPGYRVMTTGHSLGGALATLFAYLATRDDRVDGRLASLAAASPRVGCANFKRTAEETKDLTLVRICNAGDIVTALPLSARTSLANASGISFFRRPLRYEHVTQTKTLFLTDGAVLRDNLIKWIQLPIAVFVGKDNDEALKKKTTSAAVRGANNDDRALTRLDPWSMDYQGPTWLQHAFHFSVFVAYQPSAHGCVKYFRYLADATPDELKPNLLA